MSWHVRNDDPERNELRRDSLERSKALGYGMCCNQVVSSVYCCLERLCKYRCDRHPEAGQYASPVEEPHRTVLPTLDLQSVRDL